MVTVTSKNYSELQKVARQPGSRLMNQKGSLASPARLWQHTLFFINLRGLKSRPCVMMRLNKTAAHNFDVTLSLVLPLYEEVVPLRQHRSAALKRGHARCSTEV